MSLCENATDTNLKIHPLFDPRRNAKNIKYFHVSLVWENKKVFGSALHFRLLIQVPVLIYWKIFI